MPRRWNFGLLVLCGIICVAVSAPSYGAGNTFDGVYKGKRVRTEGPTNLCVAEEDVSITVTGEVLSFTNSLHKEFKIGFEPEADGTFDIIYNDISGTTVTIKGKVTGDSMVADVVNLSTECKHHWSLTKEHPKP